MVARTLWYHDCVSVKIEENRFKTRKIVKDKYELLMAKAEEEPNGKIYRWFMDIRAQKHAFNQSCYFWVGPNGICHFFNMYTGPFVRGDANTDECIVFWRKEKSRQYLKLGKYLFLSYRAPCSTNEWAWFEWLYIVWKSAFLCDSFQELWRNFHACIRVVG